MKTLPVRPSLCALALALALLPLALGNNFLMDLAVRICLAGIAAVGLNLLMGFAGQVSIGHAAFVAIGAYGAGILTARLGWPPLAAMAAAVLGAAAVAYLVGKPILRLRGHSLTMATLGLGIIVNMILVNEVDWTGGPDGMPVGPLEVMGHAVEGMGMWYGLAAVLLFGAVALSLNLYDSPAGRALRGLHGSEVAARVAGVDVADYKVRAFAASAVFTSLAGGLTAHYLGFITPSLAGFTYSVELATMVVLGGMASTFGAVLGAALLTVLPQLLGGLHEYEMMGFGLILMLTMIFLPKGLVPTLQHYLRRRP
ncbi:branched-chain amino acid ABC transporter permease [Bordetella hinzii]|uniref:branched-chain amino acid ABC transporter permease n=1 Tax=Bordetella hinzii TaxID=103855 RepID=UPI001150EAE7|nr:branched-chain amino acid ABC transporter permease [Bordetella hinzii]QDJ33047.1 branched-chain amino acid ABC transporter permease [Bordetella hinzii]QDJ51123.1 branched-chain amino acid ABC transporter permease [Bordetella hinzii]WPL81909.1 branched-chain amino acid ABC transporter permease [Bordetella hinzii]